ncbi:SagB/ThcOx family dehydrogenase [Odoribacter laneus]|uniref:SagB/ThcOx family dehydrogenase n=1 Tax=Odoribacter laneus TaxID=626933 RepID=UPI003FEE3235
MKHLRLCILLGCMCSVSGYAQTPETIKLKAPDKNGGMSVMKAFEQRQSDREFSEKKLDLQALSDLLWAANGINRPESGKRTAPSAMNRQDVDVYVCMAEGAYVYEADQHQLRLVVAKDLRPAVAAGQDWVKEAPLCLVLVSDVAKFSGDAQHQLLTGALDAGIVSENIALFCAGMGLATVPRMTMDQNELRKSLKLKDSQYPLLNNPVGYRK